MNVMSAMLGMYRSGLWISSLLVELISLQSNSFFFFLVRYILLSSEISVETASWKSIPSWVGTFGLESWNEGILDLGDWNERGYDFTQHISIVNVEKWSQRVVDKSEVAFCILLQSELTSISLTLSASLSFYQQSASPLCLPLRC